MKKDLKNNPVDNEILSKGKEIIKDFDDSKEVYVEPKPMTHKLISIRLPLNMIKDLRTIAQKRGDIGYQQVIKTYIAEGLLRDIRDSNKIPMPSNYAGSTYTVSQSSSLVGEISVPWESGNIQSLGIERSSIWK